MSLSIIIPAFNEEKRLPKTLRHIADFFASQSASNGAIHLHEIIVVDDGSTDRTLSVVRSWQKKFPVRALPLGINQGKGAACREGMLAATGDYLLLYDADAATPMSQLPKLWKQCVSKKADIAIGSRVNDHVKMSFHRRIIGRVYNRICQLLVPGIDDTACGCKLFQREVAHDLFRRQHINRFAFDVEILFLAIERGYRIAEVPVEWKAIDGSKVDLVRDGAQMFACVLGLYATKVLGTHKIERRPEFINQI